MFLKKTNEDKVLTLTINRPERGNALGPSIADELTNAISEIKESLRDGFPFRVIVLTTTPHDEKGRRTWISGGDLTELTKLTKPADGKAYAGAISRFCQELQTLPVPVIIAIDGAAIGGGAELAIAGDIRLATSTSSLVFKQLRVGLACGYGGAKRLVDLIGKAHAQRLLFIDNTLNADEAKQLGLFHKIAKDKDQLQQLTNEICREFISLEPLAIKAQKEMFAIATSASPSKEPEMELDIFTNLWMNPTYKSFLKKFAESKHSENK